MDPGRDPVAIAHDYLTQRGGAERVVLALSRAFPEAPIYTTMYDPHGTYPEFRDRKIITGPLDKVPALRKDHRLALPFLVPASRSMQIDAPVTIASSSGWAHGFRVSGKMLVYCHNPARWLYQAEEYVGEASPWSLKRVALGIFSPALRRWDRESAAKADRYLANSRVVRDRIAASYGIHADVVPPPLGLSVDGEQSATRALADWEGKRYWLVVSRLMPYKNVDVAIDAFRGRSDDRLVIVGDGPQREELLGKAPSNVRIVSGVSDAELRWIYAHAFGLLAPSREDFGLTPVEANAWGIPVVALRAGGYLDTVVEGHNGLFFDKVTVPAIGEALGRAEAREWSPEVLMAHAEKFGEEGFAARIQHEVDALLGHSRPSPRSAETRLLRDLGAA